MVQRDIQLIYHLAQRVHSQSHQLQSIVLLNFRNMGEMCNIGIDKI